jgi:hypothetical protein
MIPGHMVKHNNIGVNIKTNHVSTIHHNVNPNNSITHNPNPNHIPNPNPNPIPIPYPIQNQNYNITQSPIITSRKN